MFTTSTIYFPLQFNQMVELIKALPKKEKPQLIEVLQQDESVAIPEWQNEEVRKRVKKYNKHPQLLIDEKDALEMINNL